MTTPVKRLLKDLDIAELSTFLDGAVGYSLGSPEQGKKLSIASAAAASADTITVPAASTGLSSVEHAIVQVVTAAGVTVDLAGSCTISHGTGLSGGVSITKLTAVTGTVIPVSAIATVFALGT